MQFKNGDRSLNYLCHHTKCKSLYLSILGPFAKQFDCEQCSELHVYDDKILSTGTLFEEF